VSCFDSLGSILNVSYALVSPISKHYKTGQNFHLQITLRCPP
jgi:hypothetical protein